MPRFPGKDIDFESTSLPSHDSWPSNGLFFIGLASFFEKLFGKMLIRV